MPRVNGVERTEASVRKEMSQLIAEQWPINGAQKPTMGLPFALQRGDPPELGSGEDGGDYTTPTRFVPPPQGAQHQLEMNNGAAFLWYTPLNMASRQRKVTYRARELAGFGDGPVTLHVDWGEFGKSLFTWQGGEDEGWIMGEPK